MRDVRRVRWIGRATTPDGTSVPSVARSFVAITLVKLALTAGGLGRVTRWMRRRLTQVPAAPGVSEDGVAACEYSVAMAAAFYPGRAMCMERSLALLYLARRAGIPVTYHHGVQPVPFAAHAWVEYDGRVVNDVPEHVQLYQRFPQVCP
jgi:hypothetical protein